MSWLNTKHPIVINPDLARHVGLNEAIILQQLNYWIEATESGVEHDGRRWVYNTQEQWREQFPFWSVDTVKRAFASLKKQRLILVKQLAKQKHDRTNYYAIDHARLEEIEAQTRVVTDEGKLHQSKRANCTNRRGQIAPIEEGRMPPSNGAECPDLYTETTTETTTETSARAAGADVSVAKKQPKNLGLRELIALGVDRQHAEDWLQARRAKRLPLTATALDGVKREAEKAGMTLPQAIAKAASEGWAGFKASWIHTSPRGPAPENFESRDYGTGGRL